MMISYDEHVARYPLWASARQRLGCDAQGAPLDDDGVVGPRSRAGLYLDTASITIPSLLALVAMTLAGGRDDGGGNDRGRWPRACMQRSAGRGSVDPQSPRDRLDSEPAQGQWCAGGLSTALWIAHGQLAPHSWLARELGDLVAAWGSEVSDVRALLVGDVIVWQRPAGDGGHVAQVAAIHGGRVYCLECNTSRRESAVGLISYALPDLDRGQQRLHRIARLPAWALIRREP